MSEKQARSMEELRQSRTVHHTHLEDEKKTKKMDEGQRSSRVERTLATAAAKEGKKELTSPTGTCEGGSMSRIPDSPPVMS